MAEHSTDHLMVEHLVSMEYLRIQVQPDEVEKFVQADRDIWTTFLSKQAGFLSKQILCSTQKPGEIVILTQWRSREEWKSIPQAELDKVAAEFDRVIGRVIPFTETGEYVIAH